MTTATDAGLEVASMDRDCECSCHHPTPAGDYAHIQECVSPCLRKVPRFAVLRVPCRHLEQGVTYPDDEWDFSDPNWLDASYEEGDSSCNCQGRGWTVSDDPLVWLEYLPSGWGLHHIDRTLVPWEVWDNACESQALAGTPIPALQQALLKAHSADA